MSPQRPSRLVAAAFAATAAAAALFPLASYDLWWHLAAGRWIVAERAIPRTDPFSFTAGAAPWIDHEWLFQLIAYGAHQAAGVGGLVALRVAVVVATALVVLRFVRRQAQLAPPAAAVLLVVPVLLVARVRFLVRPELLSLLAVVVLASALLRTDRPPPGWRQLWWVPVLFAVWANVHAGMIVGLLLIAAVLAGTVVGSLLSRSGLAAPAAPGAPGRGLLAGLLSASVAAALANPFGYRVLTVPFELTSLMRDGPYENAEWRHLDPAVDWLAVVVMVAAAVAVAFRRRRIDWAAAVPLAMVVALALQYGRNVGVLGVLAPILVARLVGRRDPVDVQRDRERLTGISSPVALAVLAAVAAALPLGGYQFRPGIGIDRRQVPVAATEFLARERPPGNLLNTYAFGGWVAWRLWPETRIFIDGRNEVFLELAERLDAAKRDSRRWRELLEEYRIGHALLAYGDQPLKVRLIDPEGGPGTVVERPYTVQQFPRSRWALVYFDDTAMVLVRRAPEAEELIARVEYRHLYPDSVPFQMEAFDAGTADPGAALVELGRALSEAPDSRRAEALLAAILERGALAGTR